MPECNAHPRFAQFLQAHDEFGPHKTQPSLIKPSIARLFSKEMSLLFQRHSLPQSVSLASASLLGAAVEQIEHVLDSVGDC